MKVAIDNATRKAALSTLHELIGAGLAGLDSYDKEIFCVDAPSEIRDNADVALDILGAQFHRQGAYGAPVNVLQCWLPHPVRVELGLDRRDAPTLYMPLASRAVKLDALIDEVTAGVTI